MNPCGAEQIEEERAFWYSYPYLPAAMCWAMKSMSAATLEKTPGEPRAVVLLLLASHPLAQPTPQDTTPASVQVPPVLRHARGPPESPWWGGKEPCASSSKLKVLHDRSAPPQQPAQPCWLLPITGKPQGRREICLLCRFLVALPTPGSLAQFTEVPPGFSRTGAFGCRGGAPAFSNAQGRTRRDSKHSSASRPLPKSHHQEIPPAFVTLKLLGKPLLSRELTAPPLLLPPSLPRGLQMGRPGLLPSRSRSGGALTLQASFPPSGNPAHSMEPCTGGRSMALSRVLQVGLSMRGSSTSCRMGASAPAPVGATRLCAAPTGQLVPLGSTLIPRELYPPHPNTLHKWPGIQHWSPAWVSDVLKQSGIT